MDRGFFLTLQAMRRQLTAMPCDYYQIRLIHSTTHQPFPGDRVWSAVQLTRCAAVAFLRLRNREGYDVFFHPFAGNRNAGYILLDLDSAEEQIIDTMRANGHEPSVVSRTSPGHLQAWVRVSLNPLEPAVATAVAAHLAALYGADPASADWRHCGRLAGFTNQKPARRQPMVTLPGSHWRTPSRTWPLMPPLCSTSLHKVCRLPASPAIALLRRVLPFPPTAR